MHRLSRSEGWDCRLQPETLQKLTLGLLLIFVDHLEIGVNHMIAFISFFLWLGWTWSWTCTFGTASGLIGRGLLVKFSADGLEPGLQVLGGSLNGVTVFTL